MPLASPLLLVGQPPPVHDPEEVKQAADEILSRAEFGEAPLTLLPMCKVGDQTVPEERNLL